MNCPACGHANPDGAKFCNQCAGPLPLRCWKCGTSNAPDSKFCSECAAPLTAGGSSLSTGTKEQIPSEIHIKSEQFDASSASDGERKTVTALFADIKGSMDLMEDLDPEEARAIVDPALKLMIDGAHRYGGYIVQSTGDGIFALFGAPVAYEDHPQRALYAALRMQEEMRRYSAKLRQAGELPVEARVGLNTGEVVVRSIATSDGHAEYTPIGHSTSLAARMQALAPTGSIAATDTTRKLCEGYFTFKSLGSTVVKGVSEPVEVYEVTGLGPLRTRFQRAAVRGLTKFVGRQREIDVLKHAAEQALAGHGQIVAVMADPGVGKSRLFYEFKATSQSGWMVLEAFSVSHGKASAYLPVLELLSQYFEISRDDDDRKRRERILGKVLGLDRSLEDTLPYLYSLYGIAGAGDSLSQMDPQIRRRRTLEAIKRIMLRESLNQPLKVIFEDLHWIDGETQSLLNLLVDAIANARILLLVNYRPEYRHEWGSRTHYTQHRLDPLGHESAEEMLDALLTSPAPAALSAGASRERSVVDVHVGDRVRVQDDLAALKRLIIERTEGTPFFMEEMVQALFEEGVLQRNGTVKLARPMSAVKAPATVQAVLASRIDRLAAVEKELLQTLAVLGRDFALNLVQRVWQHPHPRVTAFAEQQASAAPLPLSRDPSGQGPSGAGSAGGGQSELEQMLAQLQLGEFIYEQPAVGEIQYSFKHALTQEVAYHSLLAERRRAIHEQTAGAIEALYAPQLEDHCSELAYHYLRGNDAGKGLRYAQFAAEQALSRAAYAEAASMLDAALKLLDKLPEGAERLRAELALRSIESTVAFVLYGASSQERERAIRRMCELGEKLREGDQLLRGLIALSHFYFIQGESARGLELSRRCVELAKATPEAGLLADARFMVGCLAGASGELREAVSNFEDAMRHSDRTHDTFLLSGIRYRSAIACHLGLALQLLGRIDKATKAAEEGLRHARESKHLISLGHALTVAGGRLHRYRREPEIVRAHAEEAITLSEENGFAVWLPWGRFHHGEALAELGQLEQGLAEMEAGVAGFRRLGGVPSQQYTIALLAQGYARMGRTEEALAMLNEALAHIEHTGERVDQAEMLRHKGEVLLMRDASSTMEAEHCFSQALGVARAQEAKWWELRSTVSLARLMRDTNRRDEAGTMLGEIYNWFTEGFDLPDLKEAKALLDELSC
jgi:class 3 adenylate cyclase/predicted ATPase